MAKILFKREEFEKCSEELLGVLKAVATPQHNWWKHNNQVVVHVRLSRGREATVSGSSEWKKVLATLDAGRALLIRNPYGSSKAVIVATPETISELGQMAEIQEIGLHHSTNDYHLLNKVPNGAIISFNGITGKVKPTVSPLLIPAPSG